jgi:hypothetical protein
MVRGIPVPFAHLLSPLQKAMRKCKVKSLPDEDDITAVDLVLAKIREKGTNYRNVFKTKVRVLAFARYALGSW